MDTDIYVMFNMKISSFICRSSIAVALILFIFTGGVLADDCELTKEYRELRWENYKVMRKARDECEQSIYKVEYWYAFTQCLEATKAKSLREGNCSFDASHNIDRYKSLDIDSSFCAVFEVESELAIRNLEEEISRKNIQKCKEHNDPINKAGAKDAPPG